MPLMPKRVKRRKVHKGRNRGKALRGNTINYGEFALQATTAGRITSNQIEAARVAMTRHIKRGGKVWIKIFPDKPVTKKPAETRMGKGKGSPEYFVAVIKPGRVLFEIAGVSEPLLRSALRLAAYKLPVQTKIIQRELTKKEERALEQEVKDAAEDFDESMLEDANDSEEEVSAEDVETVGDEGGEKDED